MKKSKLLSEILIVGLLFLIFSCDKDEIINDNSGKSILTSDIGEESERIATFIGPKVAVGNGYVFSWMRVIDNNTPWEIGIDITSAVLEDLPKDSGLIEPAIIPLPEIAEKLTPFNHISITWNPENFSDIPDFKQAHFNFYFYTIPINDRMSIPPWSEETNPPFSTYPPKNYLPKDYSPLINGIGSYSEIGRHWLSSDSKSYLPLADAFSFGTYEGKLIFLNPIVTFPVLKSGEEIKKPISQPLYYPGGKPFPREYKISINTNDNHTVALRNFLYR